MKKTKSSSVKTEPLRELVEFAKKLPYRDQRALDLLQRRARMVIRRIFGNDSSYMRELDDIAFLPNNWSNPDEFDEVWQASEAELQNLFITMLDEVENYGAPLAAVATQDLELTVSNRVFVVHGHDGEMTQATARTLEKLDLDPVVLQDEPHGGRTVIEKLDRYSDVSFAVILLSPDDMAYTKGASSAEARPRARQNVIHELGFFTGKLGRKNVLVLYRKEESFEMPSNHLGVLYVPYDALGRWKFDLARELNECGYVIDANKLL